MNYNRGNGKRWYNPRNRKPWNTGYRRYGAEPWRPQNTNHNERFRFDNRRGYNPNYRDQYANQNAINYQNYNQSTAWNNHSVLNDINDEGERRNSTFDAKSPEEAPEKATEIKSSKQSAVKTSSTSSKNDEQLVSSSDTVVTPSRVDAPSEEEHHNTRCETTPKSRIGLKDKLITELLKKSSTKIKDILSNPQQSNKYKAAFDALGKEKRLSSYNELQSKYPRSQPPPGNSSLINPEDSIELDQLPSDIVDKIENWLGLDQLDLLTDEVCVDSKPILEFLDPDTLLDKDNSDLPDEDSLKPENELTLGEIDLSDQITRLLPKKKSSEVENLLPESINESEEINNEINNDRSESVNTKETTALISVAIDPEDRTENITLKSNENCGNLEKNKPKILEDMPSLMGPKNGIVKSIENKEQTEENNTNIGKDIPQEASDKNRSDEPKVYKPCPKSKKRFEENKIFAHVPEQELMDIDCEGKHATQVKETNNESSADQSPIQTVINDSGGDQKPTEKNNVQFIENIVTPNIQIEELQNSNTALHIENENIPPNIHNESTKEPQNPSKAHIENENAISQNIHIEKPQNPTVALCIRNENVITQNIHIEKPQSPTVALCIRNDSLQNNMSNTFRSDLPDNSTYLTSDDRDIIKQMYDIEKQIQDLQNAKMKIYDKFMLAASKLPPPEILTNCNTQNDRQMQDQYVQTSCKKNTNLLNNGSDSPTSPLDSKTLPVEIEKECFVTPKKNMSVTSHRRKHSPDRSNFKRGKHKITKYGGYNSVKINEKSVTAYLEEVANSPPQASSPKPKAKRSPKVEKIKKTTSGAKTKKSVSKTKKGTLATVTELQADLIDSKQKKKSENNVNEEIALDTDKISGKNTKSKSKSDAVCSIEDSHKKLNNTSGLLDIDPIDKNERHSVKTVPESLTDHIDSHENEKSENVHNCGTDITNINEHNVSDEKDSNNKIRMDAEFVCSIKKEQCDKLDNTKTENQTVLIDSNVKEISENIISDKITLKHDNNKSTNNEEKLHEKSSSKTKSKKKVSKEKKESCEKNGKVSVTESQADVLDSHAREKSENIIGNNIELDGVKTIIDEQIVLNENGNNSSALLEFDEKVDFDKVTIDKDNINDHKEQNPENAGSDKITLQNEDIAIIKEQNVSMKNSSKSKSKSKRKEDAIEEEIVPCGKVDVIDSSKNTAADSRTKGQKSPRKYSSKTRTKKKTNTVTSVEEEIVPCGTKDSIKAAAENKAEPIASHVIEIPEETDSVKNTHQHENSKISINEQKVPSADDSRTNGPKTPRKYVSKNRSRKKTETVSSIEEVVPCDKNGSIKTVAENQADIMDSHTKEVPEKTLNDKIKHQNDNDNTRINEPKVTRKDVSKIRSKRKTDAAKSVEADIEPCDKKGSIKMDSDAKEVPENTNIYDCDKDKTIFKEQKVSEKNVTKSKSKKKSDTVCSKEERNVPSTKLLTEKQVDVTDRKSKEKSENTTNNKISLDNGISEVNEQEVLMQNGNKKSSKRKADAVSSVEEDSCKKLINTSIVLGIEPLDKNLKSSVKPDIDFLADFKEKSENSLQQDSNKTSEHKVIRKNKSKRKAEADYSIEVPSKKLNNVSTELEIGPDIEANSSADANIALVVPTNESKASSNSSKKSSRASKTEVAPTNTSDTNLNVAQLDPPKESKKSSSASKKSSSASKKSSSTSKSSSSASKSSSSAGKSSSSAGKSSSSAGKSSSSASKSSSSSRKKSSSEKSSSQSKASSSASQVLLAVTNTIVTEEIIQTNETNTNLSASEAQIVTVNESTTDSSTSKANEAPITQEEDGKASSSSSKAQALSKNSNKTSPIASRAIMKTPNSRMSTRNTKYVANIISEDTVDCSSLIKTENPSPPSIASHEIADNRHEIIQDARALPNKPKKAIASQIVKHKSQYKYNIKECSIILERCKTPSHTNADKTDEQTHEIVEECTITNTAQDIKDVEIEDNTPPPSYQQNFVADECALSIGQNNSETNLSISFKDHHEPIIALCLYQSMILAASEDGYIYIYNKDNGVLENTLGKHFGAVTGIEVHHGALYTIGLDGSLQYADMESCIQSKTGLSKLSILSKLSGPAQAFCISWNQIYIGTRTGHVDIYDLRKNELVNTLNAGHSSILSMVCSQEGPRKIILVASKEKTLSVRDAQTGLLLRDMIYPSMENPNVTTNMLPAIYCLLLNKAEIYCGTSGTNIEVYNFTSGERVCGWPGGRGTVCMIHHRGLLFSGCYDGNVYVHRMTNGTLVGKMKGPGKMLLCICMVDDKIIAGTKDNALVLWKISDEICKEMAQC